MKAVGYSEILVLSNKLHGITSRMTAILMITTVTISKLIYNNCNTVVTT
jgi:hypothetical protein